MASKIAARTTFEPTKTIEPLYTGGDTSLDRSGCILATCVEEDALIVNVETGERVARIENDGESITSLALSPSASHLVVCSRSLAMRIYSLDGATSELQRTLKPHTTPVVTSAIDVTSTLLATGGADGTLKVCDLRGGYVTHSFQGHGGVVTSLCFFRRSSTQSSVETGKPRKNASQSKADTSGFFLASGGEDGKIKIWNLHTRKAIASLESHVSVVKSIAYSEQQQTLLSASRDRTIVLWDVKSWKSRKVIPVLEVVEAAGFSPDGDYCYSGGENGGLRLWNASTGKEITKKQTAGTQSDAIVNIHCGPTFLLSIHLDQTIQIHDLNVLNENPAEASIDYLPTLRRISGSHDEVIDLALVGPDRSLLALATNTESIRIISIAEPTTGSSHFGADVALLSGHSEITICLDIDWSGYWLVSGAKDNSARLWRLDPSRSTYECFATFAGHTESLGAVALPRTPPSSQAAADPLHNPPPFLLTGSQDKTVKRWDTSKLNISSSAGFVHSVTKSFYTRVAHDKDINAIDVSSSSPLFASASQDRTIKVWELESGSVAGVLRGHKRGVWSIRFAPKDTPIINTEAGSSSRGLLVSGSGDRTVKLWSLSTYSCILTFEGHSNSVLKVLWLSPIPESSDPNDEDVLRHQIPQKAHPIIASASSDTLIKLWSPYPSATASSSTRSNVAVSLSDSHLLTTLDNHADRVWALATPTGISPSNATALPSPHSNDIGKITPLEIIQRKYPLISGSADSTMTFWSDTTVSTLRSATSAASARIEQDQELQNHMRARNYREVITLALQLNHPGRLLAMLEEVTTTTPANTTTISGSSSATNGHGQSQTSEYAKVPITSNKEVDDVLSHLSHSQLYALLCRIRDWNTNARTAPVAQRVLHLILKSYPIATFIEMDNARSGRWKKRPASSSLSAHAPQLATTAASAAENDDATGNPMANSSSGGGNKASPTMKNLLRALEVYTERHLRRTEDLIDESYMLDYTMSCMDDLLGPDDGDSVTRGGTGINGEAKLAAPPPNGVANGAGMDMDVVDV